MSYLVKKITARTVAGDLIGAFPEYYGPLFAVVGLATGTEHGDSQYGPWAALVGSFEAVHAVSKEHYLSSKLILPSPVGDLLVHAVESRGKGEVVEVAVQIGIEPNPSDKESYLYTQKTLREPKRSDVFERLLASVTFDDVEHEKVKKIGSSKK